MATSSAKSLATELAFTKITSLFNRVDGPLPIRWNTSVELPPKKQKCGPGRPPKKAPAPTVYITNSDSEVNDIENEPYIGEETKDIEEPLETKTKGVHTSAETASHSLCQDETAAAASKYLVIPRTTLLGCMEDAYFKRNMTRKVLRRALVGLSLTEQA